MSCHSLYQSLSKLNNDRGLKQSTDSFQSIINKTEKSYISMCGRCADLQRQLQLKENYIHHLRDYQKMLCQQLDQRLEDQQDVENECLKKLVEEQQMKEIELKQTIEDMELRSLNLRQSYISTSHQTARTDDQSFVIQQQRVIEMIEKNFQELKADHEQLLLQAQAEHKFIQTLTHFVVSCHPQQQFQQQQPSLKYIWNWLKNLLEDYMNIKMKGLKKQLSIIHL